MARALVLFAILSAGSRALAAKHGCVVKGSSVTLESVKVQPVGDTEITLGLENAPVEAVLPAKCGAPLELHVNGAVVFTARRDQVWLSLSHDVTSSDGLVSAMKGAHVIDACVRGDRVIASAVVYAEDVLPGEAKPADEMVTPFDIPCDALSLDVIEMSDTAVSMGGGAGDHFWELRGEASKIALHAEPNGTAAVRMVESPSCSGCIELRELSQKKGWVEVEVAGEGVTARGWVKRGAVKRVPDDVMGGHSYMCTGDHGSGGWGEGPVVGSIEREAIVAAGTHVFTGSGTGLWGVFAADTQVMVRIRSGSPWAELRRVPGIDGDPRGSPWLHGEVALDRVKLVTKP